MKRRLLIRADAGPRMGTGHVMRCLALARAAEARNIETMLAGHIEVPWVLERLKRENIPHRRLPGPAPAAEDFLSLAALAESEEAAAVVLDGYHFGLDCQKAVRAAGCRLLFIDDYGHLPEYEADFLLNQNAGSDDLNYKGRIGRKMLGPRYALLRPEFAAARPKAETRSQAERVRSLLLTLGGGDAGEHLLKMAPELNLPELSGLTLRVLAGKMQPAFVKEALASSPARVEILSGVEDMPSLLLESDLAISAGGSTCWELCCLGLPFLTVEIAENQMMIVQYLARSGLAPVFDARSLKVMLSRAAREKAGRAGLNLVDGLGADRVCRALFPERP